ncbi:xanthine dehydrogenase family protein molybdopterin-binding subunit [Mangrovicoccus ximenensis]|uniref:xanthine dehydrogenase family protein molybdopterin-binding subunit n=1 Tax=Mangrovicoccus ximenensis TaxID=1911570 RepID=UPI001F47BD75|nr:molybdopterin cofactor-binding domain-containing protein [Mangrovicoccus ximenensis]
MTADFSTAELSDRLAAIDAPGKEAEATGDARSVLAGAETVVSATYRSQYLHHAQLEPPSALARFNADGSLDLWMPNQSPEMFRTEIAAEHGLDEAQIRIHSPLLGGFFGRHFLSKGAGAYHQAIYLARATGRPVKMIWSREEEFLRDGMRPIAAVRMRGALDAEGFPLALELVLAGEGAGEARRGHDPGKVDYQAVEGLTDKPYAIPNVRIAQNYVESPNIIAPWRSVGHSANDFFYEAALDELAEAGGKDPYELRLHLLRGNGRMTALLEAAGELSGGWKRGPFTAPDGSRRARGVSAAAIRAFSPRARSWRGW